MEWQASNTPAKEVGEHINTLITEHVGDVLCLLSGGSALDIVQHIKKPERECRTIFCMGDERGSRESDINNSLTLKNRFPDSHVAEHLLMTVPEDHESLEAFANRISDQLTQAIDSLHQPLVIHVLGIGADGHTAGIFPLAEESFQATYQDDQTYVPVHLKGLTIDLRASLTPTWILNHVQHAIGYAVGESKYAILESLKNESKPIHERPAELLKHHLNATLYTDQ